jgi:NADH-quinone oxidoreductase subunit N
MREILSYAQLTHAHNGMIRAGMILILVGLGFKVAAVPFHTWTPDVYQGSPSPVTGYMAAMAKAAGFAGLLRVFAYAFATPELLHDWRPAVWALAVLTLVVGAVLGVVQTDLKRLLAYSSINHAGYVLVGLAAVHLSPDGLARSEGVSSALYYLLTYAFIVMGAFFVVTVVSGKGDSRTAIEDIRGLYYRRPFLALSMTVFLAAQAGVPFTTGFLAKFGVVGAAVGTHETSGYVLALVAMLVTAVAAFFYLRVVVVMFADPAGEGSAGGDEGGSGGGVGVLTRRDTTLRIPLATAFVIFVCAAVTVGAGLWAGPLIDLAHRAILFF